MTFRRKHFMCKFTVICYKYKSLRILVKSACRKKILSVKLRRKKVYDCLCISVVACRKNALRLVHHYVQEFSESQLFAVYDKFRYFRIKFFLRTFYSLSVCRYPAGFYHIFYLTAACNILRGKYFVYPL